MKILMWAQKLQTRDWFDPRPSESDSVTSTEALTTWPLQPYYQLSINRSYLNKCYFGVRAIEINQKSKKSLKKSIVKTQIILEEKQNGQAEKLHKNDACLQ